MKTKILLSSLIILFLVIGRAALAKRIVDAVGCSRQNVMTASFCKQLESEILNSTVRIRIESWVVTDGDKGYTINNSVGHATVMEGHKLVTHNHYDVPLNMHNFTVDGRAYSVLYLYNYQGKLVFKGPLSDYELITADQETLVFAHSTPGFFRELGFGSAEFAEWGSISLEAGMEVAQVDWDGARTRVDWVKVQSVHHDGGVPRLVIADGIRPGASGGGVFWHGVHVANNWLIRETVGSVGRVIDINSAVALNSPEILRTQTLAGP